MAEETARSSNIERRTTRRRESREGPESTPAWCPAASPRTAPHTLAPPSCAATKTDTSYADGQLPDGYTAVFVPRS
ncbi:MULTISPECIES: hypothetical protein [unclassified Streptomyces]|uniref:hypothetical protein n=1 Tax=unclassified Streptomyces TaxID=2593676 RepID=UPI002E812622|nr:hypothetical protein [Streptomyces sp. NBC_00589]WTI36868.1 hypothetical protein OIC96_18565 [Streptomyces sp. NBC_00775]WUB29456.1 hypothetical protein OHA51_31170 [Streptomyces sp. NBC_00589]